MSKIKTYLPLSIIFVYLILAVIKLSFPGFQYDELLFGNAALGDFDGTFVHKKIFKIPLMLMPYIGALKAYFYAPIFLCFETSYASVRLPMIFLSAVSLWLIYKFVLKAVDFPTAVLTILFLVADANFISLTRTDVGPVVFGLLFRALALLYFFKFVENRQSRNLIVVAIALLLGFFDKLNFVWFIAAFFIAAAVFYGNFLDAFLKLLKSNVAKIILAVFVLFFAVLTIAVFSLGITSEISLIPTPTHISIAFINALRLTSGSLFYEYLIGEWNYSDAFGWIVWTIILIGSILAFRQPKSNEKTFHFFNLLIIFLVFVQILLTDKAISAWHIFMLQPTLAILTASSLIFISRTVFATSEKKQKIILSAAAAAIFGVQFFIYTIYISQYEKPYRNIMWSKKIDELQAFTQTVPNRFVVLDWGFHTQLLTLGRQQNKFDNQSFIFNEPLKPDQIEKKQSDLMNPDNNYFFLMHSENETLFKVSRQQFFELAKQLNLQAELVKTFDESGNPLYEVYQLKRR